MLEVEGVSVAFGGVRAVDNVSLKVGEGRIVGLIGTNGAGKTTLFNVVSGFIRADKGRIAFQGQDITRLTPPRIAALGLVRTFQTPIGFPRMTVTENLLVFSRREAEQRRRLFSSGTVEPDVARRAYAAMDAFGLSAKRDVWLQDLSAPELKMMEFARAMMADAKIMLLDEPAAGVNPAVLDTLAGTISSLQKAGMTFLVVDHNLKFISTICSNIYAMADGAVIAHGTPKDVLANQHVIDLYIGRKSAEPVSNEGRGVPEHA